jgi:hypothetical protein
LPTEEELARSPAFHFQRGNEFYRQGKLDEAVESYRRCVAIQPEFPNAMYNLGVALGDVEKYSEASACLEKVVAAEPERAEAYNSLAYVCSRQRQPRKAIEYCERAIELQPNYAQARFNLGMNLLQTGDYKRGLAEYEWRWQTGQFTPFRCPHPKWDGRPIPGKKLLIHTEQGAGDAIQFARYIPLAAERCGKLILVCREDLMPIFSTMPGIAEIRAAGQIGVAEFDVHVPLLSLPHLFGTTLETIPAEMPYIDVSAARRRKDNPALELPDSGRPKVGIVWAGSATHRNDRHRSIPLKEFLPVLQTPGIAFFGLQKGERACDLAELPPEIQVQDLDPRLGDFGDLAVIVDQLDLAVSVDTSVAHVAGALGKPVWTLLSDVVDWRWGLEGETTPWYPTMRLFRQTRLDDWAGVMERVAAELKGRKWPKRDIQDVKWETGNLSVTAEQKDLL